MNHSDGKAGVGNEEGDEVARLLRLAGPRPQPEAELETMARAAVEHEWRSMLKQRRHLRARRGWLAAAVIALTVTAGVVGIRVTRNSAPAWVGTIVSSRGPLQVTPTLGHGLDSSGDALVAGTRIETGNGGGALLAVGSVALRLAGDSALILQSTHAVHLLKGSIYVDSGGRLDSARSLLVETEFGSVSHRGTQYQVQAMPGRYLFAAVREGQVVVTAATGVVSLARGDAVRVTAANEILRETLPPYSEAWQWVSEYAPEVSIDGRPLSAFIDWYARETGLTLRFVAPATRADADRTILRGTVSGLSPQQALAAVLATTDLDADLTTPGELRIGERADAVRIEPNGSELPSTPWIHR